MPNWSKFHKLRTRYIINRANILILFLLICSGLNAQQKYKSTSLTLTIDGHLRDEIKSGKSGYGFQFHTSDSLPYQEIGYADTNRYIVRSHSGFWGIVDTLGNYLLPPTNRLIRRYFNKDYFVVNEKGRMGVLHPNLTAKNAIVYEDFYRLKSGPVLAKKNGKWGVIKDNDEVHIDFLYDNIDFFSSSYLIENGGKVGVLNEDGSERFPIAYKTITPAFDKNLFLLQSDDNKHLVNRLTGQTVDLTSYEMVGLDKRRWSGIVKKDGLYGIIKSDGLLPDCVYSAVVDKGYNKRGRAFLLKRKEAVGYYVDDGGMILPIKYLSIQKVSRSSQDNMVFIVDSAEGKALVSEKSEVIYQTESGEITINLAPPFFITGENKSGELDIVANKLGETMDVSKYDEIRGGMLPSMIVFRKNNQLGIIHANSLKVVVDNTQEIKEFKHGQIAYRTLKGWRIKTESPQKHDSLFYDAIKEETNFSRFDASPYLLACRNTKADNKVISKWGVLAKDGELVIPIIGDEVFLPNDSIAEVHMDSTVRIYNLRKRILVNSEPRPIWSKSRRDNKNKYADEAFGKSIKVNVSYGRQQEMPVGGAIQLNRHKLSMTERGLKFDNREEGQKQLPDGVQSAKDNNIVRLKGELGLIVWMDGKLGVIDTDGNLLLPAIYDGLGYGPGSRKEVKFYIVQVGDKFGYLGYNSWTVGPVKYDEIRAFQEGTARVRIGLKWGAIDIMGREIIPVEYDLLTPFENGLAKAYLNGVKKYIDKHNSCKFNCQD